MQDSPELTSLAFTRVPVKVPHIHQSSSEGVRIPQNFKGRRNGVASFFFRFFRFLPFFFFFSFSSVSFSEKKRGDTVRETPFAKPRRCLGYAGGLWNVLKLGGQIFHKSGVASLRNWTTMTTSWSLPCRCLVMRGVLQRSPVRTMVVHCSGERKQWS